MYVDYRIINEKEVEVINDRGEIIKITGLNTGDIKKAIPVSYTHLTLPTMCQV